MKLPTIDLSGKTFKQRQSALLAAAPAHAAYLKWYEEHQKLYQEVHNTRAKARSSLQTQLTASSKGSSEPTGAQKGAATKAANAEKSAAVAAGDN